MSKYFNKEAQLLSKPTTDLWNSAILQNIDYARYLLGHKYNVASAGIKTGVSPLVLIKHDWTKFRPSMFKAYKQHFFGAEGAVHDPIANAEFRKLVDWHYQMEDHHRKKLGLPESVDTEIESICDWYSVGKTNADIRGESFPNFKTWWNDKKNEFLFNNQISKAAYDKIELTLQSNYNILTYSIDQIKDLFKRIF